MVAGLKAVQTVALIADNRTLVVERLLEGFAEVPGPKAMPRREHVHQPPSDYEVH
jgi:hypothetical protein